MPDQPADTAPVRVTVYGSCVSRDAVDLAGHGRVEVTDYIARQSLISGGHDAASKFPEDAQFAHQFQRRMMIADFAGDLRKRIWRVAKRNRQTDLLLWDLTDERHGVHIFEDGTVVTRSIDLTGVPEALAVVESTRHVPFGTDEHFDLWSVRAEEFYKFLRKIRALDRTVVLQVPWATTTVDGQETPGSMGISATAANEQFQRYFDHLRQLGFTVLELRPEGVLADPEHRWGLAPFHYAQEVYEEIVGRVLESL